MSVYPSGHYRVAKARVSVHPKVVSLSEYHSYVYRKMNDRGGSMYRKLLDVEGQGGGW